MPEIEQKELDKLNQAAKDVVTLTKSVEDLTTQVGKTNKKNEELLGEKKTAQQKAKDAEKDAANAIKKNLEEGGNYKELYEASEKKNLELTEANDNRTITDAKRDVTTQANKIAGELAEGKNVALLSTFIAGRLKSVDGKIKVTDKEGGLTVHTMDELTKEIKGDETYASLIKGSQSSGGGANGGKGSDGVAGEIGRADFDAMSQQERRQHFADKGTVVDDK